jgi:hypothetical protein
VRFDLDERNAVRSAGQWTVHNRADESSNERRTLEDNGA